MSRSCVKVEVDVQGYPVTNNPHGFCGRKATVKKKGRGREEGVRRQGWGREVGVGRGEGLEEGWGVSLCAAERRIQS